jgi:repressor LexA
MDFLCKYTDAHGYPPTVREIKHYIGNKSNNGIDDLTKILARKGWIKKPFRGSRAITILARPGSEDTPPRTPQGEPVTAAPEGIRVVSHVTRDRFPLVRSERVIDVIHVQILPFTNLFGLRMDDASMEDDGILTGDYVLVSESRCTSVKHADMVVAFLDDAAVVRRIFFEADSVRFSTANQVMGLEPVVMKKEEFSQPMIIGVVVGIYRKLNPRAEPAACLDEERLAQIC